MIDIDNPDWEQIKSMVSNSTNKEYKEYICKKCKEKFISPRYAGKFPLCKKHRLKD